MKIMQTNGVPTSTYVPKSKRIENNEESLSSSSGSQAKEVSKARKVVDTSEKSDKQVDPSFLLESIETMIGNRLGIDKKQIEELKEKIALLEEKISSLKDPNDPNVTNESQIASYEDKLESLVEQLEKLTEQVAKEQMERELRYTVIDDVDESRFRMNSSELDPLDSIGIDGAHLNLGSEDNDSIVNAELKKVKLTKLDVE